jgi:uncharacterized protein (DUF433 family)
MSKIAQSQSLRELTWVDPDRVSGALCFRDTRVPVALLFEYLAAGDSLEEFLQGFPTVRREQAVGVLQWVAQYFTDLRRESRAVGSHRVERLPPVWTTYSGSQRRPHDHIIPHCIRRNALQTTLSRLHYGRTS